MPSHGHPPFWCSSKQSTSTRQHSSPNIVKGCFWSYQITSPLNNPWGNLPKLRWCSEFLCEPWQNRAPHYPYNLTTLLEVQKRWQWAREIAIPFSARTAYETCVTAESSQCTSNPSPRSWHWEHLNKRYASYAQQKLRNGVGIKWIRGW